MRLGYFDTGPQAMVAQTEWIPARDVRPQKTSSRALLISGRPWTRLPVRGVENGVLRREHLLQDGSACGEELADFRRILAAGFGEVRTSAAAAANDRRQQLHDLARRRLLDEIRCDANDDRDLAVEG